MFYDVLNFFRYFGRGLFHSILRKNNNNGCDTNPLIFHSLEFLQSQSCLSYFNCYNFRICFRISLNCWNKKHFSILYGMLIKMFLLLRYDYYIFPEQLHQYSYLFYPEPFYYKSWEISGKHGDISIPRNFVKQTSVKALKDNL